MPRPSVLTKQELSPSWFPQFFVPVWSYLRGHASPRGGVKIVTSGLVRMAHNHLNNLRPSGARHLRQLSLSTARSTKRLEMTYWTVGDLTDREVRAASRASITALVFSSRGFT